MKFRTAIFGVGLGTAISTCLLAASPAFGFDKFEMRALGGFGNQLQSNEAVRPFFTKQLPQAAKGNIGVTFRTLDEVGLKGFEAMRLLKLGVFDAMEINLGYVGGDEPFFMGLDMVGIAPDIDTMRKLTEAFRPHFDKLLEQKFNGKLLTLWPYSAQSIYCKGELRGLSDLKGKKIRVYTPPMAALMKEVGAIGVTIAAPEVYQALQRGVLDCAITGTTAGNDFKWPEVTTHFYPLTTGWSMQAHVANLQYWKKLPPDAQKLVTDQFANLEKTLWDMSRDTTKDGGDCNIGAASCKRFTKYKMTLVKVTPDDLKKMRQIVSEKLIPEWVADCKKTQPDCVKIWNDIGGKITGVMAK